MKTFYIIACIALFASCNSSNNTKDPILPAAPSYQETKLTLRQTEDANPIQFLKVEGTYRQNFINQWVMEGKIINTATVANYKDVVLKITYYSKTDTELGSEQKIIYENYKPNESKDFKIKSNGFDGTGKVGYSIIKATATN